MEGVVILEKSDKLKEKTSRTSLAIVLSVFVFIIIVSCHRKNFYAKIEKTLEQSMFILCLLYTSSSNISTILFPFQM